MGFSWTCECGLPLPPTHRKGVLCPCGMEYDVGESGWNAVNKVEGYFAHKASWLGPSDCDCEQCDRAVIEHVAPALEGQNAFELTLRVGDQQRTVRAEPQCYDYAAKDVLVEAGTDVFVTIIPGRVLDNGVERPASLQRIEQLRKEGR